MRKDDIQYLCAKRFFSHGKKLSFSLVHKAWKTSPSPPFPIKSWQYPRGKNSKLLFSIGELKSNGREFLTVEFLTIPQHQNHKNVNKF